jgi:hypothetical protein
MDLAETSVRNTAVVKYIEEIGDGAGFQKASCPLASRVRARGASSRVCAVLGRVLRSALTENRAFSN